MHKKIALNAKKPIPQNSAETLTVVGFLFHRRIRTDISILFAEI